MDGNWITAIVVFILMAAGVACLFLALARLRDVRRVRSTPVTRIGVARPGWTALSGSVRAARPVADPAFGIRCLWWRCVVQEFNDEAGPDWRDIMDRPCPEPFLLDDGSGAVLLAPQGAEFHLNGLEELAIELTADNQDELAPLLRSWGVRFVGRQIRFLEFFRVGLVRRLRVKVQLLQDSTKLFAVGRLCPDREGGTAGPRPWPGRATASERDQSRAPGGRLAMRRWRNEPLVISTQPPDTLPRSLELRAAGRAAAGLLLLAAAGSFAWLLKTWGFWLDLTPLPPLSAGAAIAGSGTGWVLKRRGTD